MSHPPHETHADPDERHALPKVGEVISGRFALVRQIGRGGMGVVFEARHLELDRSYAVKFLRSERMLSPRAIERFKREARLLAKLNHVGIVNVVDVGYYLDVSPFIVMEYVSGEPLSGLIAHWIESLSKEKLLELSLQIMKQLAQAMQHAHEAAVLHRDLKPDNILVSREQTTLRTHVVDFGIAFATDAVDPRLTPSDTELGTPHYMSPEQARGRRDLTPAADVYALGAIYYQLLTGKLPHPGDSYNSVVFHILTQPVQPIAELNPETPEPVTRVVMRCLETNPDARYSDAGELLTALEQLPRLLPETVSTPETVASFSKRSWVLFATGAGVLVAAGLLLSLRQAPEKEVLTAATSTPLALAPAVTVSGPFSVAERQPVPTAEPSPMPSQALALEALPAPGPSVNPPPRVSRPVVTSIALAAHPTASAVNTVPALGNAPALSAPGAARLEVDVANPYAPRER